MIQLYVDMDGVLTDIEKAINAVGSMSLHKTNKDESWKRIAEAGVKFWSEMPWMPDGKKLWNYIRQFNPTILSSTPRPERGKVHDYALEGKKIWIKRELGSDVVSRALIVSYKREKARYAKEGNILIDDLPSNITDWEKSGGTGILHVGTVATIRELRKILGKSVTEELREVIESIKFQRSF